MALPLASILGSVAVNAATPYLSKVLGGVFGVDEAERKREQALAEIDRVAQGGTTQGQAGIAYARGRALSDLASMAQRGTAQQQAGLQRAAMQQGADIQAQYAAQLAELRSREQERARQMGGFMREQAAAQEAKRRRDALAGAVGGALGGLTKIFTGTEAATDAAATEAARVEESKKLLGSAFPGAAPLTGGDIARELGMTGASAAAPAVAGVAGGAPAQAAGAAAAAPMNEIEAELAAQDRTLASLDPSVRAAIGPSEEDQRQAGLAAFGGVPAPARRAGAPVPVTASERAMMADTAAGLRAERNLATQPSSIARGAVFGPSSAAVAAPANTGRDSFASLADRAEATSAMAPVMKSPLQQGAAAPMTPTVEPMAFSYQGEQTENLRKQRPGRMPRRPAMKKIPGGGGFAL